MTRTTRTTRTTQTADNPPDSPTDSPTGGAEPGSQGRPVLHVVRGDATPEEIAALVAVLAARAAAAHAAPAGRQGAAGAAPPDGRSRRTGWADRSKGLRAPLAPGPGAWRASARPR